MSVDMPTWAVLARLAGCMKAQADEKRKKWIRGVKNGESDLHRARYAVEFLSYEDAAFRVSKEARREWWRAEEARMRAARWGWR